MHLDRALPRFWRIAIVDHLDKDTAAGAVGNQITYGACDNTAAAAEIHDSELAVSAGDRHRKDVARQPRRTLKDDASVTAVIGVIGRINRVEHFAPRHLRGRKAKAMWARQQFNIWIFLQS